jgi:hypothetical protein
VSADSIRESFEKAATIRGEVKTEIDGKIAFEIEPGAWTYFQLGYRAGASEMKERAAQVADNWANSISCRSHEDNPCCHVRTGTEIAARVRSLEVTK